MSGALSTAQQVGNSIGIAVTGVIFFGVLNHGYAAAFALSSRPDGRAAARRGGAHAHPEEALILISMATLLTIGEFSRMTHLSVKALRHYHDVGVLEPAAIDPFTGYRSYDANQVASAQVIRRLRDLGMSLDSIAAVIGVLRRRHPESEIAAHLERMELQLEQTQAAVAGLRALLAGPALRPAVEVRKIPAVTALAVRQVVSAANLVEWGSGAFDALSDALSATGAVATSPFGALFPGDFFEIERSEITVFAPVEPGRPGPPPGGHVRLLTIRRSRPRSRCTKAPSMTSTAPTAPWARSWPSAPSASTAPFASTTWSAPSTPTTSSEHSTEVCWPVFLTGVKKAQRSPRALRSSADSGANRSSAAPARLAHLIAHGDAAVGQMQRMARRL